MFINYRKRSGLSIYPHSASHKNDVWRILKITINGFITASQQDTSFIERPLQSGLYIPSSLLIMDLNLHPEFSGAALSNVKRWNELNTNFI